MDDTFSEVYPLALKLQYLNELLKLQPLTLLPLTPLEEARTLQSMPSETPPLIGHPATANDGSISENSMDFQYSPYTHRFRRKLILRHQKRIAQLKHRNRVQSCPDYYDSYLPKHPLNNFDIDDRVRAVLRELTPRDLKLSNYHQRRSIQYYNSSIVDGPTPALQQLEFDRKKGRRSKECLTQIDEKRSERRRLLAQQQAPEIPQLQQSIQYIRSRQTMMQTWIQKEDGLAIKAIVSQGVSPESSDLPPQYFNTPFLEHYTPQIPPKYSSFSQEYTRLVQHIQNIRLQQSLSTQGSLMDVTVPENHIHDIKSEFPEDIHPPSEISLPNVGGNIASKSTQTSIPQTPQPSSSQQNLTQVLATQTLNSTSTATSSVGSRMEEIKKQVTARGGKDSSDSKEMEAHLRQTLEIVDILFDSSLDPYGKKWSFEELIFGDIYEKRAHAPIVSTWSGRTLKPIIRQDYETLPPKLLLLRQIEHHANYANPEWIAPEMNAPLEYRYLRPWMIPQVKRLLALCFWPGVEISEWLLYPEFTIVILYKELVIGCGFITNFGYICYICVHPEWRKSHMGKFMLYHLIQTCSGKDITLHVSCNNPAMIMYQSFCFKIEERIINFYDKFLPTNSKASKHAYFMRLRR